MEIRENHKKKNIPIHHKRAKKVSPFLVSWNQNKINEHKSSEENDDFNELMNKSMSWIEEHKASIHTPISIHTWHIVVFTILVIIVSVPIAISAYANTIEVEKNEIKKTLSSSLLLFQTGVREAKDGDALTAKESFVEAHTLFTQAELSLRDNHPFVTALANIAPKQIPQWSSVHNALEAGRLASKVGVIISDSLHLLQDRNTHLTEQEADALITVTGEVEAMVDTIRMLVEDINPSVVPEEDRQLVLTIQKALPEIESEVKESIDIIHFSAALLGYTEGSKKILVVFQNNAELRATGGFMGSYAMIKMDKGEVILVDVPSGGTYDFQGTVRKAFASPSPLHLINPVWQFQDANWWPDWQASAEKVAWFYEEGDGATVDYVISVTPTVLENFLRVVGPIMIPDTNPEILIDHNNVYSKLQSRPGDTDTKDSKKIIGDSLSAVFLKVQELKSDEIRDLLPIVKSSLKQKHILLYAKDSVAKNVISHNRWGGDIESGKGDYVMAVHTNIAGGKSDRDIKDRIYIESIVLDNGKIENNVTITRTHHGQDGHGFGGVRNVDYIRLYVPRDAELIDVKGYAKPAEDLFEKVPDGYIDDPDIARYETFVSTHEPTNTTIMRSFGKTVFANWMMVDPGTSSSVTFTYTLPFIIEEDAYHQLTAVKQPGLDGVVFEYALKAPNHLLGPQINNEVVTTYSIQEVMTSDIHKEVFVSSK